MPTSSATLCCGNNIFVVVAQGMTIFEMVFTVLLLFQSLLNAFNIQHGQPSLPIFITVWLIYLSLENYGLMKKKDWNHHCWVYYPMPSITYYDFYSILIK